MVHTQGSLHFKVKLGLVDKDLDLFPDCIHNIDILALFFALIHGEQHAFV